MPNVALKNTLLSLLYSLLFLSVSAQEKPKGLALQAGYFGHTGIFPGGKLSAEIPLKTWTQESTKKDSIRTKAFSFFVAPGLGFYGRQNFYSGLLVNLETGIKRQRLGKKAYLGVSISLGYLHQATVIDFKVDFSGNITDVNREQRPSFLPQVNGIFGWDLNAQWGLYTKLSHGTRFTRNFDPTGQFFAEFGLSYQLNTHD